MIETLHHLLNLSCLSFDSAPGKVEVNYGN